MGVYSLGLSNMFTFGLRQLEQNQQDVASSIEKLATGKKVNRASDDPSAIAPITNHEVEIYSLNKQLDALAQKEGFLGAKEGGLSVVSDLITELESLVVQAANKGATTEEEQQAYKDQIDSIVSGIDRIARTTTFNGRSVLEEYTAERISEGLGSLSGLIGTDPEKAQEIVRAATDSVVTTRAAIGNTLNEIDTDRSVIAGKLENLNASLSSLQDTDYAEEAAKLVRSQILEQASIAAISINRDRASQVLGLLQGAAQQSQRIAQAPAI